MFRSAIVALLVLPTVVAAQDNELIQADRPVICGSTESILPEIYKQYKEVPMWGSQLEDSKIAIFANPDTNTWTLIQWNKEVACLIEAGKDYFLRDLRNSKGI